MLGSRSFHEIINRRRLGKQELRTDIFHTSYLILFLVKTDFMQRSAAIQRSAYDKHLMARTKRTMTQPTDNSASISNLIITSINDIRKIKILKETLSHSKASSVTLIHVLAN